MKKSKNFDFNKKHPKDPKENASKDTSPSPETQNDKDQNQIPQSTNKTPSNNQIDLASSSDKQPIQPEETHLLPESEMLLYPDFPPNEINRSEPFAKCKMKDQYETTKKQISNEIITGVENGIDNIMKEVKMTFIDDHLKINKTKNEVNRIIPSSNDKENKKQIDIEENIKKIKIKDLEDTKQNIQRKLMKLDENLKIINNNINIDNNNSNSKSIALINPNGQIEENIKKAQMKEIKTTKEILNKKLNGIEEQIQNLLINEEEIDKIKKVNIKQFIDNFEKDKALAEERALKYEEEMKQREIKIQTTISKAKEKREKEFELQEKEEEEKKKKQLERLRLKELEKMREKNKENQEKVNYFMNHLNDKPANENAYLFKVLEKEYKIREENNIKKEILKHRAKIKEGIVTLEEIEEFAKKQKENEIKREIEIDEERKKLKEQWKNTKDNLPKFESSAMQKLKEEEQKSKLQREMEENKKKIKMKEIKNYGNIVTKMYLPKIDQNIKKEREDRIKSLTVKNNIQKHKRKHNRILLVKPDPSKPKKYNWDIKQGPIIDKWESDNGTRAERENKRPRSKSEKQRVPLDKPPDYLTEIRLKKLNEGKVPNSSYIQKRPRDWERMIKNNKNTFSENVEQIKMKAMELEEKAKRKEKLLKVNREVNLEMQENVSNMLIDAIKAKLTILENIKK